MGRDVIIACDFPGREETLRFENPQTYYVDLSKPLWDLKHSLIDPNGHFVQLTPQNTTVPTTQAQFLRDNIYRYYGLNDKILTSTYSESDWNAFYESVIEPIALQLSLEFTYKLLSDRERGFGNKIIFTSNRLQYASLQTRMTIGGGMFVGNIAFIIGQNFLRMDTLFLVICVPFMILSLLILMACSLHGRLKTTRQILKNQLTLTTRSWIKVCRSLSEPQHPVQA